MKLQEFVFLYRRDLTRLKKEISAYLTEESLWAKLPGTVNSGGNICQHLIGNLRTYIGLQIGEVPYVRDRDAEFNSRLFTTEQLLKEIDFLLQVIPESILKMNENQLAEEYPHDVVDIHNEQSFGFILMHLYQHLAWHTGQINYHRRIVDHEKSMN